MKDSEMHQTCNIENAWNWSGNVNRRDSWGGLHAGGKIILKPVLIEIFLIFGLDSTNWGYRQLIGWCDQGNRNYIFIKDGKFFKQW